MNCTEFYNKIQGPIDINGADMVVLDRNGEILSNNIIPNGYECAIDLSYNDRYFRFICEKDGKRIWSTSIPYPRDVKVYILEDGSIYRIEVECDCQTYFNFRP